MTPEEIVKDLRDNSSYGCYINHSNCIEMHKAAASLIETLTSQLSSKDAQIAALTERADRAKAELGRAIWDIGCLVDKLYLQKNYQCLFCKYYLDLPHKDYPIDDIPQCGRCDKANGFKWYGDKFEWRGAREGTK